MREHLDSGRPGDAARLAHTLKGVAGNIGARRIAAAAKVLEEACGEGGDAQRRIRALDGVEDALAPTLAAIERWRREAVHAPAAATGPAMDVGPVLDRLQGLLEQYDAEAVDVIDELEKMSGHGIRDEDVLRLRLRVDDFDFDDALEALAEIREGCGRG